MTELTTTTTTSVGSYSRTYEEATIGFELVPPTYGGAYGTIKVYSKHADGQQLFEEIRESGQPIRAWMTDADGHGIGA